MVRQMNPVELSAFFSKIVGNLWSKKWNTKLIWLLNPLVNCSYWKQGLQIVRVEIYHNKSTGGTKNIKMRIQCPRFIFWNYGVLVYFNLCQCFDGFNWIYPIPTLSRIETIYSLCHEVWLNIQKRPRSKLVLWSLFYKNICWR